MSALVRHASPFLRFLVLTAFLAGEVHAQRAAQADSPAPFAPPLRRGWPQLFDPVIQPIGGDSPLTELARFAGHVDAFVDVSPRFAFAFQVSGVPAGSTIRAAWLEVTSFDPIPGHVVSASFDGEPLGSKLPDVVDFSTNGNSYYCSLYRFDVTTLVAGDGFYAYTATGHSNFYGDALIVVYEHPSLPLRTLEILDGAESIANATTTSVFDGLGCGSPGELQLFTQADDDTGIEEIRWNGATVLGPADIFGGNDGYALSLVTVPVPVGPGANTLEVETGVDWFGLHVAVLSIDGVQLDFETEDDFATALVNGQAVASPQEFGALAALSGSGANLGPAIFDSLPAGPNDPSQDEDLLVGLGNMLILQNSAASVQTVPGIFDRPNDDQDGGAIVFDFTEPVAPRCLVLIDIDTGSNQASSVTLTDFAGNTRVYTVPPRWTEDLLLDGPPAWRRLDLTTLAPQAGFLSAATASESLGFAASGVVRLRVQLGSSGAIDELMIGSP